MARWLGTTQDWTMNLMAIVDHAEREHGDREIVSSYADGSVDRSNWRKIVANSRRLANKLVSIGIEPKDRVATICMNHGRHLVAWYGTVGMGGVLHTINPRLFPDQLTYIVNHAEDRVLFYDAAFAPLIAAMKPHWKGVEHFVVMDPPADWDGDPSFDEWIGDNGDFTWIDADERDPVGLCYTSGTTGNPKGVVYEHRGLMLHALAEVQPDVFNLSKRSCVLPIVPMFHANAWGIPWAAPMVGCKMVLPADYTPSVLVDLFKREKVTHSAGVPTVWLGMIQHLEQSGDTLDALENITIGGAAAPRAMIKWFRNHGVEVGHAWGMTELAPLGSMQGKPDGWEDMTDEEQVDYTVRQGRVPFGIEMRIVDDDGTVLPRDGEATGDLQVRGPWTIGRYFKADEDAVDADGWFSTGDVAALHPDGSMQITDRSKDVIKSGGEWISSIELENAALSIDGVAEAGAIGIAHPKWDERPLLCVVRKDGSDIDAAAIIEGLRGQVAKWWLPDAVEFVDELPHTATGKISKKTLREQFKDYRFQNMGTVIGRD